MMGSGFYKRGEGFDDETGLEVLKKAFDLGISLLNTADFYGPETNELLIGMLPAVGLPSPCLARHFVHFNPDSIHLRLHFRLLDQHCHLLVWISINHCASVCRRSLSPLSHFCCLDRHAY